MSTREAIDAVLNDFRRELHTCFPARVLAYDVTAQTVDVQPAIQRERPTDVVDEPFRTEELPILYSVPVQWPRAGGGLLTFPIAVGDWVEISCAEQSLLVWRATGGAGVTPGLNDPLGLNGAIAKPGWYPDTEKASGVSATDVELRSPTGGSVVLGGQTGAQFVALATLVEDNMTALSTALAAAIAAVVSGDGGLAALTALQTSLQNVTWPLPMAATKVKAK